MLAADPRPPLPQYYVSRKERAPARVSEEYDMRRQMWDVCEESTGVRYEDIGLVYPPP